MDQGQLINSSLWRVPSLRTDAQQGLLAVPFVLLSQPTAVYDDGCDVTQMSKDANDRYAEIMRDVEKLVQDHSKSPRGFRRDSISNTLYK